MEQLARGSMVSGMHSIATIATEFELQVSIYRFRRYCRYRRETEQSDRDSRWIILFATVASGSDYMFEKAERIEMAPLW